MPTALDSALKSKRQRAGLEGVTDSVMGRPWAFHVGSPEESSDGAKAMVDRSVSSVASTEWSSFS